MDLVDDRSKITRLRLLLVFSWALIPLTLRATPPDPSDLFLKAYQEFHDAERLERKNAPDQALAKYRYAANILSQLQRNNTGWQPLVVSYRLRKTQESITRLETVSPTLFKATTATTQGPHSNVPTRANIPSLSITPPSNRNSRLLTNLITPNQSFASEIRQLRWQLEQVNQENQRLATLLTKAKAEKQCALIEIDKIKVSLIEAKSQNSETQGAKGLVRKQTERIVQLEKTYNTWTSSLQKQINTLTSDNDVLSEENERLLSKLEKADAYIRDSDRIRKSLSKDRQTFYKAEYATRNKIKQLRVNNQLLEKLKKTNREFLVKNSEFSQKIAEMQAATAQANLRAQNAETQAKKFSEASSSLSTQLTKSKEEVKKLQKEDNKNSKLLTQLRSDLDSTNQRLLHSQSATIQRETHIADLEKQLESVSSVLTQIQSPSNEAPDRQKQENELLRGIILREMKRQTQRDHARQLINDELKRIQANSTSLFEQLAVLGQPIPQLTEQEKSLFQSLGLTISHESAPSSLSASFSIIKKNVPPRPSATSRYASASDQSPTDTLTPKERSLAKLAEIAFKQGKFADSETLYGRIIKKNPKHAWILANLGAVQSQLGKYSAAEDMLHKALALNPSDTFATTTLGVLQLKRAQVNNAIETLRNSVKLDSQNFAAHNYLGIAYGETGRLEEAEKELKTAIQLNPNYAVAHFNLAVLYSTQELSNKELARKHYLLATHLGAVPDATLERLIR